MSLVADEREVVVIYNDAEGVWHVYSDSSTMRGTIRKLAQRVGAEVRPLGEGVEFTCPREALKLAPKRKGKAPSEAFLAAGGRKRKSSVLHGPISASLGIPEGAARGGKS